MVGMVDWQGKNEVSVSIGEQMMMLMLFSPPRRLFFFHVYLCLFDSSKLGGGMGNGPG